MRVNALLAAKNFAVHQQNILVGNGAAELIKALMARLEGHRLHPPHLRGVPQPLSGPAQRLLHPGGPGLPVHR